MNGIWVQKDNWTCKRQIPISKVRLSVRQMKNKEAKGSVNPDCPSSASVNAERWRKTQNSQAL
jgi:hypothetical protein